MIWVFFVPFSFLEVVPSGTTQGYFHPKFSFFYNIKKKFKHRKPKIIRFVNLKILKIG
jgi:hypothetical protein